MKEEPSFETQESDEDKEGRERRLFLQGLGKWSLAAISAALFGGAWFKSAPEAKAGIWINRWGPRRGGWINRWGPRRGRWINRWGPGGRWINRW